MDKDKEKKKENNKGHTQLLHIAFHGVYYFSLCFILIFSFLAGVMERLGCDEY